jgi:hypothetical protein
VGGKYRDDGGDVERGAVLIQDREVVGGSEWRRVGEGEGERLPRVGDENELEARGKRRREELGEDGTANTTQTEERDGDGAGHGDGVIRV